MSRDHTELPNGYIETINRGIEYVRRLRGGMTSCSCSREEAIAGLKEKLRAADAVVIGAGAGLSAAAGFSYAGERFEKWFSDFSRTYGIRDMYSGGFYPYPSKETFWAFFARNIYVNRYLDPPKPVYEDLYSLVKDKDYFVITTNVDHCFQKAGFDKTRLFYTQGDYGLFQSTDPSNRKTYGNEAWVDLAMEAQGFVRNAVGLFEAPEDGLLKMEIPTELLPKCPDDGADFTMNLRSDDSFVEDEGWHRASAAYLDFLESRAGRHVLFLELGIGMNTPVFCSSRATQKTAKHKGKQQVLVVVYRTKESEERRCA